MRILVVCQHYFPENFTITPICEELVKRGHAVTVVTGQPCYGYDTVMPGYEKRWHEQINGVDVFRVKVHPRRKGRLSIIANYLSFWRNSKRFLRHLKGDYDVVYSMSLSPLISVAGANQYAKEHHIRHILDCLDLWPESTVIAGAIKKDSLEYRLLYKWSRDIYAQADEIIISSPSFEGYFRNVLQMPDKKLVYIPQPALLTPMDDEPIIFEHKYNLVYAGNIGSLQLVENLVEGAALLDGKYDFQIHLIGMGSRIPEVEAIIGKETLYDAVDFIGPLPRAKTARYFPNCTGLLVSLRDEGPVGETIPNKLISGLAYGKPIIASIGGDGRKILEEAGGAIFASEDPADIAKAYEALFLLSDAQRADLGEKNRAYYDSHFDFGKIVSQIEAELAFVSKS